MYSTLPLDEPRLKLTGGVAGGTCHDLFEGALVSTTLPAFSSITSLDDDIAYTAVVHASGKGSLPGIHSEKTRGRWMPLALQNPRTEPSVCRLPRMFLCRYPLGPYLFFMYSDSPFLSDLLRIPSSTRAYAISVFPFHICTMHR